MASVQLLPFQKIKESEKDFFEAANILFETAPVLRQALLQCKAELNSYEELIHKASELIKKMSHNDRLEVINAHPRIGLKPSANVSVLSYKEQGMDKDQTMEQEKVEQIFSKLTQLNDAYEKKHGFKFVTFVNGRTKEQLIPEFEERLGRSSEQELEKGLTDMLLIAQDRLKKLSKL